MNKVVITGIGILSRIGNSVEVFWDNILSGGTKMEDIKVPLELPKVVDANIRRRMDRFSYMALTASKLAVEDSDLKNGNIDYERFGTVFSTGYGPINSNFNFGNKLLTAGPSMISPTIFAGTVANACIGHTCMNLGLKGVSTMLMGSCSVGYSFDLLKDGRADAILTGGIEEYNVHVENAYEKIGYTSKESRNSETSYPLDKRRNGITLSEGAVALVLENAEHAQNRNAKVLAEVVGYGCAFSHISIERANKAVESKCFVNSMKSALKDSNIRPEDINAIYMAASGSRYGDQAEAIAIHEVFGCYGKEVPVTTINGLTGKVLGASTSMGIAAVSLSLYNQVLPPTAGYSEVDEELELNVVFGEPLRRNFNYIMINGYEMGGGISTLILKSIKDDLKK